MDSNDATDDLSIDEGYEIAKTMLRYGGNPNTCYMNGMTPFLLAVQSGTLKEVELHLRYGACLETENLYRQTALHLAAQNSENPDVMEYLAKHESLNLNARDYLGYMPLHYAVQGASVGACMGLLQHSVMIDGKNNDSYTPLGMAVCLYSESLEYEHHSLTRQRRKVVELLLRIIAVKTNFLHLIDDDDELLLRRDKHGFREYYDTCFRELGYLKTQKYSSSLTWYHVLLSSVSTMAACMKYEEYRDGIYGMHPKNMPIYYDMFKYKYIIARSKIDDAHQRPGKLANFLFFNQF